MAKRRRNRRRPPAWLFPRQQERRFMRSLRVIVADPLEALVRESILPRLPSLVDEASGLRPNPLHARRDAWPQEVFQLRNLLTTGLSDTPAKAAQSAQDIAIDLSNVNRNQWTRIMRSTIGVEVFAGEPWFRDQMNTFVAQNASQIGKLSEEAIANIESAIQRGLQSGARVEGIAKDILNEVGKVKNKAKFIARDQVSKFNAQLTELRQTSIGVSQYIWRTSRDERVRGNPSGLYPNATPSHHVMNGKLCRWDDATVYSDDDGKTWKKRSSIKGVQLHPGQDFQCRCSPEPDLEPLLRAA